ncbi:MAG: DUF4258 domain-containing protein [bacterium]|nr:DUF4258 domain-containing protein [bacterium]
MNKSLRKRIAFSEHALEQMRERGATREEVQLAMTRGEEFPAKKGRKGYRLNFPFNALWGGKQYATRQVVPIVAEDPAERVVVTVYVFYF